MSVTIKDVAKQAGVSIATVSHVINKTRYVSPELAQKVIEIIDKSSYKVKIMEKESRMHVGKNSVIAFLVPNIGGTVYSQLTTALSHYLLEKGYLLSVYFTGDDRNQEKRILEGLMTDKRIAGIILAPVSSNGADYAKLFSQDVPFVCLERSIKSKDVDCVLSENVTAIYMGTSHLIKSGHENIAILLEKRQLTTEEERLEGYCHALEDHNIRYQKQLVVEVDLYQEDSCEKAIQEVYYRNKPTAFIAGGNRLTLVLLKTLQNIGLECPKDVSVVGFGDEEWCELAASPLTTLKQNTEEMGRLAAEKIICKIQGNTIMPQEIRVPVNLSIRKSTQMIGRGPFGEKAFAPEELSLSEEEAERLRTADYKVGIAFHYSGTAWTRLHEKGIRKTLEKFGVTVVSVTDAHFNPLLQVTQLEGLRMQKPDAIIAIPADDKITARKFKELSKETKLVFISNVPEGFQKEEYSSCVSVNERENGNNAGILMGEYFKKYKRAKVGFIGHGAPFYGTHLRDLVAEQVVRENYPNVDIMAVDYFYQIEHTYDICKEMMLRCPEIQGLYISWDRPALEAIRALKELGRDDVSIFTFDLDVEIATYLKKGEFVKGLSTQRPYEQGTAVALATAKALLGQDGYKYIGVPPYVVQSKNLLRAWQDIMHESAPEALKKYISSEDN